MRKLFKKFFKKKNEGVKPAQVRVITPFPEDYAGEVKRILKVIQEYDHNMSEEEIEQVRSFYFDSIDWINSGESLDLDSFYQLIVDIIKYMPSEVSTDGGNDFRLENELYWEGVRDKEFFLEPKNEKFLLKIVALGPEADHLLCEILSDLAQDLDQNFLDQCLEIIFKRSTLNDCTHFARWAEVSGNVLAELISANRFSEAQLEKVYKFLDSISANLESWQINECRFQLAQNAKTPLKILQELAQDQSIHFGYVKDDNQGGEWVETEIAMLALRNLQLRESAK